jgi:hypothetical protein
MRRTVLNAVAFFAAVALVIGCENKKGAEIPSKLDQPIPQVAAPAGGGGQAPAKTKAAPPNTKAD